MARSGYSDDGNYALWQGAVKRALHGTRGQAFLQEMLKALDSLPQKILIPEELQTATGEVCALGAVGKLHGLDMGVLDPENHQQLGKIFNIAPAMVQEIEYQNDDDFSEYSYDWRTRTAETPAQRFIRMRKWVVKALEGG